MQTSGPDNKKKILIAAAALLLIPTAFIAIRQAVQPGTDAQTNAQKQETVSTSGTEGASTLGTLSESDGADKKTASTGSSADSAKSATASGASTSSTATSSASKTGSSATGAVALGTATSSGTTSSKSNALEGKPAEKKGLVSSILGAIFPSKAPAPSVPGGAPGLGGAGSAVGVGTGTAGGLAGGAKQAQIAEAPAAPPVPTQGCYTVTFHHKKTSGHSNEEACTQHKNLIRIPHPNPASICVRMNKVPVAFELVKGKTNELVVGAIAGPKAEITARYCVGHSTCAEDCKIPKDDFMDAIGAGGEMAAPARVAQWDPADKADKDSDVNGHLDAEMKRELDKLDEAPAQAATEIFKDWLTSSESPACGSKHAMN